ncbi:FUSC family protein [Kitasatospora sp. NE20-6]|uniref:FUSC family protein n=1 Tax=Kitasatospora sp. NE20-6 TaxID=2859066 RepID=UPI0034DC9205
MFASTNDLPGTRRAGAKRIGVTALAGALGLMLGQADGWAALPLLFAVGLVSGAVSVTGRMYSSAALQMLVLTAIGSGMPLALPTWLKVCCFLAGAGWLLLLRLALPAPGTGRGRAHGERLAVGAVFDALAAALAAVGTPAAEPARRRLTTALDQADDALRLYRLLHFPGRCSNEEARLTRRFAAAAALSEAAVALLWEGEPLPARIPTGPRRLAAAARSGSEPGRLPAPAASSPTYAAFDRAVLEAALAFGPNTADNPAGRATSAPAPRARRRRVHPAGPAGREYGLRVAVCVTTSAVVALLLHADHWYWLPATAAFLTKPDLGPLFSRTVNRFVGTAVGVLVFTVLDAVSADTWWLAAVATATGALIPLAMRHYALQTAAVTVTVLCFIAGNGESRITWTRLVDTALASVIVLLVGHVPRLADARARVGHRLAHFLRKTDQYLDHVLTGPSDQQHPEQRADLRRAVFQALAEARAAAENVTAELTVGKRQDWLAITAAAESIAHATVACAVRLEHGAPSPAAGESGRITTALAALADTLDGQGTATGTGNTPLACGTLNHILTEIDRIRELTGGSPKPVGANAPHVPVRQLSPATCPADT